MTNHNSFFIENKSTMPLLIYIEPEGVEISVNNGTTIEVIDEYSSKPVTLRVARHRDSKEPTISIWPGDGKTVVKIDGKDPLD
jgi:hypothetical protein